MKAPKFKEFISEAKSDSKLKLLIITDEPEQAKQFHTADRLKEEADKLKIESYLFHLSGGYTQFEDGIRTFHNKKDDKGFVIDNNTIAVVRGSVTRKDSWMDFISILEKANVCLINSRQCISICVDKYRSALKLGDYGLTQPKSILVNNPDTILDQIKESGIKFPLIMKTLRGSKGVGVLFIDSERGLDSIVQLINKQDEDSDLLVQEYIKTDYDVRVLVLGGKVLAAMKRPVIEGDFRSNVSQGSKPQKIQLTELEIEESLKAAKAVNGLWVAVDFIPSQQPEKEPPYILEVNHSPGTKGIESTGTNVVENLLVYFQNPKNRHPVAKEIGRYERVELVGLGMIVANFDTGNSARAIIHSDDWKVKNKKVTWKAFGKSFEHDLVEMRYFEQGKWSWSSKTPIERPVIHLDVEFNGTRYTDVQFLIDDRGHKTTKCLMNQRFMRRSNVMINPAKTFVVSTKHGVKPDGKFKDDAFDLF